MSKKIQWWVLASGVLMVIGAFGTWELVGSDSDWAGWFFLHGRISGTDGSNDGWLVVVAAVIAGGLVSLRRTSRDAGARALLGGVAGLAVTAYDLGNLQNAVGKGSGFEGYDAHVGWGLVLALLASIWMAIAGLVAVVQARSAPAAAGASSAPPVLPATVKLLLWTAGLVGLGIVGLIGLLILSRLY